MIFSPKTSVNTLAGAILGALIGVLIVFVMEWLDSDIVRTAQDVERFVGVTVLGSIPTIADKTPEGETRTKKAARSSATPKVCPHCGKPI